MKKLLIFALTMACCLQSQAQKKKDVTFSNSFTIEANDSHEFIVEKAAHVVPTPNQLEALRNEFIAFIHFGPNTFTRMEWGNGKEDPKIFDLKNLDTDQWCKAMKAAGMKMVIFTAKHHDGFCLWQSRYTKHGIMSTNFRNGKGDVMKDLSASCQKYGLKLGVYLSPADLYHIENADGLYGNLSKYTKRTIPREVPGRPFKNKTKFEYELDDYNEYFMNQLFELLTEYGPIHEVWFDGAHPKRKGGQTYTSQAWKELIHTLAPEAVIFGIEDIRWCGNESGITRPTEWNVIPRNPEEKWSMSMNDELGSRDRLFKAKTLQYQQAETNTSIREGWFYRDDNHQRVRSTDDVFDIYERTVGGNSTFLLNIPPNREGRFSDEDVRVLNELGQRIKETYGVNLLKGAKAPKALLDKNDETYITVKKPVVISMKQATTINRIVLQEAISKQGERIESHAVDAWIDGQWKEVVKSTNVGYKRILRFPEVTTNKLRIRILSSRLTPTLSNVEAHYYHARPPRLTYRRTTEGMVTLEALKQDFNWKSHGIDFNKNLNAKYQIYYTTDGTEPTTASNKYNQPFFMDKGILKAIAIQKDEKGALLNEQLGFIKKNWTLIEKDSETNKHEAKMLMDENNKTYWMSQEKDKHFFSLNLDKEMSLKGFAYTPQQEHAKGMMAKGNVLISEDGHNWKKIDSFEFGNLINDPSKRIHFFAQPIKTKYLRIEATEIAENGKVITVAEFDLF